MVEGGAEILKLFLDAGFADETRVEVAPVLIGKGVRAPRFSGGLADPDFPAPNTLLDAKRP